MATSDSITIEVDEISKRFGEVVALDRVSFTVARGELFFLLGPSGCGKTTLLRILAGLETPEQGALRFNGENVMDRPPHLRGAPMVFQNYSLWPHLTVAENVAFGLVERGIKRGDIATRTTEALARVGLQGLGGRTPGQLSGGQQQRVALARALVLNPHVVLLDEPLSNLDAKLRAEMREEIEHLHATSDITFIYVTHDQVEALSLADRMAVIDHGRVRAVGKPHDLYHRPPNAFCAEFLGEANLFEGKVVSGAAGAITVETAFGRWAGVSAVNRTLDPGTQVRCLIRPENLKPCLDNATPAGNRIEAVLRRLRMNGSTITALLETGGREMKATLLNHYGVALVTGRNYVWQAAVDDTVMVES